jgi:hypothetical protein
MLSHLIEPRFDEFQAAADKLAALEKRNIELPTLAPFRAALGETRLLAAGGFGPENYAEGIEDGSHDLVAMGRYFMYVHHPCYAPYEDADLGLADEQRKCRPGR